MRNPSLLPALLAGVLLAHGARAQYDDPPTGGDNDPPAGCTGVTAKVGVNDSALAFSLSTVVIRVGEPVCWTWNSSMDHNVKADDGSFTSGPPASSGTFQRTFTTPGTFGYHCQVHGNPTSGMRGNVVVQADDDEGEQGPGTLRFAGDGYTVSENAGTLSLIVERTGGTDGVATTRLVATPGSAKPGKDYLPIRRNASLRWENGEGGAKTFAVSIKNDNKTEPAESFTVKLTQPTGAGLGSPNSATVTVQDDDGNCPAAALAAPSQVKARGASADEIRLSWSEPDAWAVSYRIERQRADGSFEEIGAVATGVTGFLDSRLPAGTTFRYRVRAEGGDGSSAVSAVVAGATDGAAAPCDAERAVCLGGGRFAATVQWQRSATLTGTAGRAWREAETPNAAFFSVFPPDDVELLLNVVDGCRVNGHYWISFAGVTHSGFTLAVRDTETGGTWTFFHPEGTMPSPVQDLEALATCP